MKKRTFMVAFLSIALVGCAQHQSNYRLVNDVDHMKRVEAASTRSVQSVDTFWINPPKKKVKRDN